MKEKDEVLPTLTEPRDWTIICKERQVKRTRGGVRGAGTYEVSSVEVDLTLADLSVEGGLAVVDPCHCAGLTARAGRGLDGLGDLRVGLGGEGARRRGYSRRRRHGRRRRGGERRRGERT